MFIILKKIDFANDENKFQIKYCALYKSLNETERLKDSHNDKNDDI